MCGRLSRVLSLVLLVSLLFSSPVTAEKMYQISESELAELEDTISKLETELQSQVELTVRLQTELSEVRSWLATSEKARVEAQSSLVKESLSFDEYEREAEKKIRGNEAQNFFENLLISAVSVGAGYALGKN